MAHRLPLFPLDVVLFPGSLLPLHIFEPRYRTLLADVLSGDRRFGVVPLGEDGGPPAAGVVGTTALLRATHALPDGRSNIVVSGESRFQVREYLEEEVPYPTALVEPYEDEPGNPEGELLGDRLPELTRLAERCADALRGLTDDPLDPEWASDPARLTFQIAALIGLDRDFKHRFLGMRSAAHRAVLLLELLPGIASDLEGRASIRRGARRNGTGGSHPDIALHE